MKSFLCPCEDITRAEVEDAVRHGYGTLEDLKRYTGLATGSCQGRLCLLPAFNVVLQITRRSPTELGLITFRPPLEPVPLALLGADAPNPEAKGGHA